MSLLKKFKNFHFLLFLGGEGVFPLVCDGKEPFSQSVEDNKILNFPSSLMNSDFSLSRKVSWGE